MSDIPTATERIKQALGYARRVADLELQIREIQDNVLSHPKVCDVCTETLVCDTQNQAVKNLDIASDFFEEALEDWRTKGRELVGTV